MKTVNYTPDPKKKPQLTAEQEAKLAAMSDEDIDYSDIEELDDDFWDHAQPVTNDLPERASLKVKASNIQNKHSSSNLP